MQKIYLVLTHTGTLLSNLIKLYTKNDYSHISIAFDEDLDEMYSFGRIFTYNAFIGGLVREYMNKGTFKRFKKTCTSIYSIDVSDNQYNEIKNEVLNMYERRREYKFNFWGVFFVMFNKKIKRKNALYCAEFVKYALDSGNVNISTLPEIIKPEDFKKLEEAKLIYKGLLQEYKNRIRVLESPEVPIQIESIIRTKAAV